MQSFKTYLLAAVLFFGGSAAPAAAQTIVDIAAGNEDFETLVTLVTDADLVDTLNSDGPFTVFAPTDDAFGDLPAYVGGALERNPELVTDILLYHVVADELFAEDVLDSKRIETVQGESLRVNLQNGDPFVDNSQIVATDIDASNGVVHVIDTVLIPDSVYKAIIRDIKIQVRDLLRELRDVRQDQVEKKRIGSQSRGWGNWRNRHDD